MIYLDNAATTRPCAEAVAAVNDALTARWGNPSAVHRLGIEAARLLRTARQDVAEAMGAETERVFFTSGGTEADNWAIFSAAERLGITQEILMEINIGAEESKSGVGPDDLWPLLDAAAAKTHIKVRGLMAIPPADADDTATRRFFAEMRELLAKAAARGYENARMNILSMGMSHDYAAAIAEGATIVRVGTAIYGARDYSKKK